MSSEDFLCKPGITQLKAWYCFYIFILHYRDAKTNEWIGEFIESSNTHSIPECSAITHADNKGNIFGNDESILYSIWFLNR